RRTRPSHSCTARRVKEWTSASRTVSDQEWRASFLSQRAGHLLHRGRRKLRAGLRQSERVSLTRNDQQFGRAARPETVSAYSSFSDREDRQDQRDAALVSWG